MRRVLPESLLALGGVFTADRPVCRVVQQRGLGAQHRKPPRSLFDPPRRLPLQGLFIAGPSPQLAKPPHALARLPVRRQGDDVLVRARGLAGREVVADRNPLLGAGIRVRPIRADAVVPDAPETVRLDEARRAALVAFVEGNQRMPDDVKARLLKTLEQEEVPLQTVERLEGRMGG